MRDPNFKLRHSPVAKGERESWLALQTAINTDLPTRLSEIEGIDVEFALAAVGVTVDQVVPHSLGRPPRAVQILGIRPLDGQTPFSVWEKQPPRRSDETVVIRSDTTNAGDIVTLRLR